MRAREDNRHPVLALWGIACLLLTLPCCLCPLPCLQYLGAVLLVRALRRSRVQPRLLLPTAAELQDLFSTFGVLSFFYFSKNCCYLLLQARGAR